LAVSAFVRQIYFVWTDDRFWHKIDVAELAIRYQFGVSFLCFDDLADEDERRKIFHFHAIPDVGLF
jgi:Mg2+ and Co2+ transporter CorA